MARGRMVNSKITMNKAISDLSDDTSRLAFTWLITFADVQGRCYGDPAVVRSLLFPRRADISIEQMKGYIEEWATAGLVIWYEAEGDQWIAFPKFDENQRGLDRRKEPKSEIPAPPEYSEGTDQVRADGVPDTAEKNRTEENRTEEKALSLSDYTHEAMRAYEGSIGLVNGARQADEIRDYLEELHKRDIQSWWYDALAIAEDANKRSWAYMRAILRNCLKSGKAPVNGKNGDSTGPPKVLKRIVRVRDPDTGKVVEHEVEVTE